MTIDRSDVQRRKSTTPRSNKLFVETTKTKLRTLTHKTSTKNEKMGQKTIRFFVVHFVFCALLFFSFFSHFARNRCFFFHRSSLSFFEFEFYFYFFFEDLLSKCISILAVFMLKKYYHNVCPQCGIRACDEFSNFIEWWMQIEQRKALNFDTLMIRLKFWKEWTFLSPTKPNTFHNLFFGPQKQHRRQNARENRECIANNLKFGEHQTICVCSLRYLFTLSIVWRKGEQKNITAKKKKLK